MDDGSVLGTVGLDPAECRRVINHGRASQAPLQYFTLMVLANWMRANGVAAAA